MSKVKTQSGKYVLRETNTVESIAPESKAFFNKLWIYPCSSVAASLLVVNAGTIYIGEKTESGDVTPDPLAPGTDASEIVPLEIELPQGETKPIREVLIQGTAGDGVWFKWWLALLCFLSLTSMAQTRSPRAATQTEVNAGTSKTVFVTPYGLANKPGLGGSSPGTNVFTLINFVDHGGDPTGSADCTAALSNILATVAHPYIYFPGTFKFNSSVTIRSNGVVFAGAGTGSTTASSGGKSQLLWSSGGNGIIFGISDLHDIFFRDLTITGKSDRSGNAFTITNGSGSTSNCKFENLEMAEWNKCFDLDGVAIDEWDNVNIQHANYGIFHRDHYTPFSLLWKNGSIVSDRGNQLNGLWTFLSMDAGNSASNQFFFVLTNGARVCFIGCNIEQNVSIAPCIKSDASFLTLINTRTIGNGISVLLTNGGTYYGINSTLGATSNGAPIWSYNTSYETVVEDGIFRSAITNAALGTHYTAAAFGQGLSHDGALYGGADTIPNSQFIDDFKDVRGDSFFVVLRTNGTYAAIDLAEYFKDKYYSQRIAFLDVASLWTTVQKFQGINMTNMNGFGTGINGNTSAPGSTWGWEIGAYQFNVTDWYVAFAASAGAARDRTRIFHDAQNNRTTIGYNKASTKPANTNEFNVEGNFGISNNAGNFQILITTIAPQLSTNSGCLWISNGGAWMTINTNGVQVTQAILK